MTMLISRRNIIVLPLLVISSWLSDIANSEGDVGCLFNHELCEELEECFDDNAFGRCQSSYDSEKDFYRHILGFDTMKLLEKELSRLFTGGYRWEHEYTQCVVQNILYAKRHKVSYDPGLCSRIMQMSLPVVPPELIAELETSEPKELALIKFTPNREKNQDLVFADESFTPPEESNSDDTENEAKKRTSASTDTAFHRKKYPTKISSGSVATEYGQDDTLFRHLLEVAKDTQKILDAYSDTANRFPSNKLPVIKTDLSSDMNHRPIFTEGGMEWLPVHENELENDLDVQNFVQKKKHNDFDNELPFTKQQRYHINKLQSYKEMGDNSNFFNNDNDDNEEIDVPMIQEMMGKKGDRDDDVDNFKWNVLHKNPFEPDLNDFTEEFTGDRKSGIDLARGESNDFLQDNMFGVHPIDNGMPTFQRPMRYDTKKPGPTYFYHDDDDDNESMQGYDQQVAEEDNNILAQLMKTTRKDQLHVVLQTPLEKQQSTPLDEIQEEDRLKEFLRPPYFPALTSMTSSSVNEPRSETDDHRVDEQGDNSDKDVKRTYQHNPADQPEVIESPFGPTLHQRDEDKTADVGRTGEGHIGHFDSVDATHAYLLLKETSATEQDAEKLVKRLEKLLELPRGTFSNTRLEGSQVTFKVNPNSLGLNASDVAVKAEDRVGELKKETGLTVQSAGIGDKVKYEVVNKDVDRNLFILTFVLCGGVVGVLLAVAAAYIIRRHARSKEKLQDITQPDTEASQDYQDLCRQRMASKTNEKVEAIHATQSPKKVRSLSQEGQASSSSHSSTSSWNEEPVTSNMDISTGHMILSYMEDHLKNKDRLDREWEALCAYEAEPCSTASSTLTPNIKKNRYPDVLPYDHSRVILNELSNVSGSDYINASTITDHDPRNPAYIATQGPLPHTAADFWQMIWEQGSVVMVMLTRLMENGVAMCHRHWPEEGSEVYHIYEVHLVSEHIWCDDYLVRSFYLKNLRTSETRTVTQFHFLSWPDNGVPNSTKALLEFRRKVNKSYRGRSCPIVVHCSDGIGRTGTYCLIDMVLNRMAKGAKEIDIAATLEHVRDQRAGMVKTKAQFEFVLMAIAEEVHAILKALSQ